MAKGSKSVPKKCTGSYILRCLETGEKGIYQCSVKVMETNKTCAGALIDTKKGTVRFYA